MTTKSYHKNPPALNYLVAFGRHLCKITGQVSQRGKMAKEKTSREIRRQILLKKRTQDIHLRVSPEMKRALRELGLEKGDSRIATYIYRLLVEHVAAKRGSDAPDQDSGGGSIG